MLFSKVQVQAHITASINNGDELWLKQTGISADVNLSLTRAALTIVCSFQTSFFPALPSLWVETKPFFCLCLSVLETRQDKMRRDETTRLRFELVGI